MEGHISTISQFKSSFLCPTYQRDPRVRSFFAALPYLMRVLQYLRNLQTGARARCKEKFFACPQVRQYVLRVRTVRSYSMSSKHTVVFLQHLSKIISSNFIPLQSNGKSFNS